VSTVRIAVASTPLTATLDEAVPAAIAAVEEAGRLGARIVCLPEAGLPGHRSQARPVPDVTQDALDDALHEVAEAARKARVVTIVGAERPTLAGREITSIGFRYPEIARSLVLGGAQIIFAPHFVLTDDGLLPARWCDASNPYNEKALLCRALENTVYVAAANVAGPDQGSATCIIAPDGTLVTSLDYGRVGVVAAGIDLDQADRMLALRWAPERNIQAVDQTGRSQSGPSTRIARSPGRVSRGRTEQKAAPA
jgi:predicted amidohydrolase